MRLIQTHNGPQAIWGPLSCPAATLDVVHCLSKPMPCTSLR